jgi:phage major head subunit gpT-like protein
MKTIIQAAGPISLRAAGQAANFRITAAPDEEADQLPTFSMILYTGGPIRPIGWWRREPLIVDLAGLQIPRQEIPIDKDHWIDIGHSTEIRNDGKTLTVEGVLSGYSFDDEDDDQAACAAHEVVRFATNGFPWQSSMEGSIDKECDFIAAGGSVVVNGQTIQGPVYVARAVTLLKAAILSVGADGNTMTSIAAAQGLPQGVLPMTFEQFLQANGFDPATVTASQRAILQSAFQASQNPAPPAVVPPVTVPTVQAAPDAIQEQNRIAAQNVRRLNGIRRVCAAHSGLTTEIDDPAKPGSRISVDIEAHAIEAGWSEDRTELEVLRCRRPAPVAPHGYVVNTPDLNPDVITAAVCRAGGLATLEKSFNDQTLQAAHTLFPRGMGLQQMLTIVARRNGYIGDGRFSGNADTEEILRAAFGARFQASGVSTAGLSGILSNVANKFLLMGYMSVESFWQMISAKKSVKDFKQVSSYRLLADTTFVEVGEDGNLTHANLDDDTYTNQARTYGILIGISRKKLRDDDLGALTDVPKQVGRGGAEKFNLVFWTEFMDNSTFFQTDNSAIRANANYFTGAGTVLSITALTDAETLFLNQVKPDGSPLGIEPSILLTPNALSVNARVYTRDQEIWHTMPDDDDQTLGNPHAGKWTPVRSSYLSNSTITGYSTTAWYLLADPQTLPVIESVFLDGVETPMVETAQADFKQLGIQMRGFFDFGVSKQDPRGGVKSKGAA